MTNAAATSRRLATAPTTRRRPRLSLARRAPRGTPRFVLYSHDALGLGHVRRNLAIAAALVRRSPHASVLLVTSADHAERLGVPERVDLVRLPALRKVANGRYTSRRLSMEGQDLIELRGRILAATVASFRPSVLLVDKHPLGVGGELRDAFRALGDVRGKAVLGLRDVLDDPDTVRAEWTPEQTRFVLEHYARVLVYGDESVFDTLRQSGLPAGLAARSRYCGYVTAPTRDDAAAVLSLRRLTTASGRRPRVLATTGGGEDGRQLLEAFVEAATGAAWEAIAVTGPQLAQPEARALRERAASGGVTVRTFVPELAGWFAEVDALVCMGGYNTLVEALFRGAPTLCVPRTTPRREQLIRANALAARDLLRVLEPTRLNARSLRDAVTSTLERSRKSITEAAHRALGFDGAAVAAESLLLEAAACRRSRSASG